MSSREPKVPTDNRAGEGSPNFFGETTATLRAHQSYLVGLADLAAAEATKVGLSLALLACATGLLLLTLGAVWIFVCAAVSAAVVAAGASWLSAFLTAIVLNAVLALALWLFVVRMCENLGFSHLRAALKPTSNANASAAPLTTRTPEETSHVRAA